jgi:hypothetical protein
MPKTKTARSGRERAGLPPATLERMLYYLKLTREAESRIEHVRYRQGKSREGSTSGAGRKPLGSAQPCLSLEVVDLRSLLAYDEEAVLASVRKCTKAILMRQ